MSIGMTSITTMGSVRKMQEFARRAMHGARVVDRWVLVGVALAGATLVALLPRLVPCGATTKEPYPRYAEHAEF